MSDKSVEILEMSAWRVTGVSGESLVVLADDVTEAAAVFENVCRNSDDVEHPFGYVTSIEEIGTLVAVESERLK